MTSARLLTILLSSFLIGCSAPAAPSTGSERSAPAPSSGAASGEPRTLVMAFRYEKNDLSTKTLSQAGQEYRPVFNAGLAIIGGAGTPQPQLAVDIPQVNTESWRVSPDGSMETTWQLKPGLVWHDGQPLTADDFVFAWQAYSAPGLGIFSPAPQDRIGEVRAPDARTVVFHWNVLYPDADHMTEIDLPPLPRHLMGDAFESYLQDAGTRDAFVNHRYWNDGYVGAGPFRLERLDPGSGFEGSAFAGYALGRPKVDRIIARIMDNENAVLSAMLAESIQVATAITLRFEHAVVLQQQWGANHRGTVSTAPSRLVNNLVQFRPELLRTPALGDTRVRKAMVYSLDLQALNDALFEGQSINPDHFGVPGTPSYAEIDRTVTKYAFDPKQTEQMMNEAGYAKDRDGFFANGAGERFRPDFQVLTGTQFERGGAIMADTWQRSGIDVQLSVLPAVQVRQNEVRDSFPGISTPGAAGGDERGTLEYLTSRQIGRPENGWTGPNRGAWSNADYDRLWDAYNVTLDRDERGRVGAQMLKLVSDELPAWPIYWDFNVMAYLSNVTGPDLGIANSSTDLWNIHEWEVR